MTSERVLLRLLCSKRTRPHVVGKVVATETGRLLELQSAVRTGVGNADYRATTTRSVFEDEWTGSYVWCGTCRKALHLSTTSVAQALEVGRKAMALDAVGYLDDPLGVHDRGVAQRNQAQR